MARIPALCAIGVCVVALAAPTAAAAKPAKLKSAERSQEKILDRGGIQVKAKGLSKKVRVSATAKTFDAKKRVKISKSLKLSPRDDSGKLKLSKRGRNLIGTCQPQAIKISGKGVKSLRFDLRRDLSRCKAGNIDLSNADKCDPIVLDDGSNAGQPQCMIPFPDDFHTVEDYTSDTGRRVAFNNASMPQNSSNVPIAAEPYNLNDGFSPGQAIVTRVPGLDTPAALEATDPITLDDLSQNDEERAQEAIVVIDAETGERHPIWVEIDSNGATPEDTALLIHPATNFKSGRRYIVAMRNLRSEPYGQPFEAPDGFRIYRDDLKENDPAIEAQRDRFDTIFRDLRSADIKRSNLYLAWDFTVATNQNIAERMLSIRDDAFEELGDTTMSDVQIQGDSPSFTVTSVTDYAVDPELARMVEGTLEVPCYLKPDCGPGGRFDLDSDGLPTRNGTYTAPFRCGIPRAALDDPGATPGRPQVYGHGLLGSRSQATSGDQQILGQTHNFVICSVDTIGFASEDVPNIASSILPELGQFPELTDRVQQGLLNTLYLGRLMWHPDGFVSDPAFRTPSDAPVIDTSRLYYNGNSQGGILGGAATAVAPDWTRASLGVPAMNYSVLLNRSVDFDLYSLLLDPAYPTAIEQQLVLSQIQMLWDRSEANGYAHVMTDSPLPDTPAHKVLMNVAFGDHQVSTWQADVQARTIGAQIHEPVVYPGRWPGVDVGWGIDPIDSYPYDDSAIVYWDSGPTRPDPNNPTETIGTDPPPVENLPNRTGEDPHSDPRVAPEEMQMVSDFLRPDANSQITDTCLGLACYAGLFNGP